MRQDIDATESEARTRVAIADDSVLLREGIVRLLEETGFEVVAQSGTAEDLLLKVRSLRPDIAIVDIRMPPTHTDEGLRAAQEIRERYPQTSVLVLSQYVESGYALDLLAESAEAVGYLLKDRVSDVGSSRPPCSASRTGAPRWILRSWRAWSAADAAGDHSTS